MTTDIQPPTGDSVTRRYWNTTYNIMVDLTPTEHADQEKDQAFMAKHMADFMAQKPDIIDAIIRRPMGQTAVNDLPPTSLTALHVQNAQDDLYLDVAYLKHLKLRRLDDTALSGADVKSLIGELLDNVSSLSYTDTANGCCQVRTYSHPSNS